MSEGSMSRKSLDDLISRSAEGEQELKRVLGPMNLTTLGIGAIIGAGIFVLTGQAAARYAGPAIALSFIISGIGCAFAGLCYAEFASMIPRAGSAYTYAYATLGQFFAWIIGWDLILEYMFGASTVAVGWSGYVVSFLRDFNIHFPPQFMAATGTSLMELPSQLAHLLKLPDNGWVAVSTVMQAVADAKLSAASLGLDALPHTTAILNLPAMFIIAALTALLVVGIKESAIFNNFIVIIKLSVLLLFIVLGFAYVKTENWTPFIPESTSFGEFGWSGIFRGAGVIFFAYIGFDAVSTAAQEARNPQRDMPIGILGSLVISSILYILVAIVLTGIVKYDRLNDPAPIAVALNATRTAGSVGLGWLIPCAKFGAIAGLSSVVLVMLLGQPRIFYAMANDGLLPPFFAHVHPKYRTPYVTTILTGTVAMLIAGVFPIHVLGELVSIGTLLAFVIVCLGIWVLRRARPDIHRPFKTPWVPVVPILGALIAFAQMAFLPLDTWLRLLVWMAVGLAIYFGYSRYHSKTAHPQE